MIKKTIQDIDKITIQDIDKITSVLKLNDITIRNVSFERYSTNNWSDFSIGFNLKVNEIDDDSFEMILSIKVSEQDIFDLEVKCGAIFEVKETNSSDFHKNAVAIIFPYIRSYITQITSIPNMEPIVLPVININALLDGMKK